MSKLTASVSNLQITSKDLENIHNDPRISKSELVISSTVSLFCANNGDAPITEQYQMYAKGLIYEVFTHSITGFTDFTWVAVPFVKFYNAFEEVAKNDLPNVEYKDIEIVKKQDGTLISRWQYKGKVYFSTRGNILTPGKLFYDPVMKIVNEKYPKLAEYHPGFNNVTVMLEYVGPSNVIMEKYEEDDLIAIGKSVLVRNEIKYKCNLGTLKDIFGVPITPSYDLKDPKEVLKSMEGIQEGVIVNYINDQEQIVYRVKYKHEEYLKALKVRFLMGQLNFDPIKETIEHITNYDIISSIVKKYEGILAENPFREELLELIHQSLTSEETGYKLMEIMSIGSSLDKDARWLRSRSESGMERKDVYNHISNGPQKPFRGILMKMVYGYVSPEDMYKDIYKQLG